MSFQELGLSENTLKALGECGYSEPTPIQAQAIPHILMSRDVVGLAQTGTGKTAGFTLPMIEILAGGRAKARMPRSLILSPTRELAAQIAENFDTYGKYHNLNMALLTGGVSMDEQVRKLDRGVDVLIATPGRMLDLFDRGKILLTDIKILVIDEADRMMDMGFIPDIEKIVSFLPVIRQTLLFSATMPPVIKKLTEKFLMNPREVSVAAPSSTAENVAQTLVWTTSREKKQMVYDVLKREKVQNAFIFCNRKRDIDGLRSWLSNKGFPVGAMHGDLSQEQRTKTLQEFKDGKVKLLVCSDVAARGIDVDDVSHVLNFDVPHHAEDYVHRIGRTGRAGKDGHAWMFGVKGNEYDEKYVKAIEKLIDKKIEVFKDGGKGDKQKDSRSSKKPAEHSGKQNKPRSFDKKTRYNNSQNKPPSKSPQQKNRSDNKDSDVIGFGNDVPGFFSKNS